MNERELNKLTETSITEIIDNIEIMQENELITLNTKLIEQWLNYAQKKAEEELKERFIMET